MIDMIIKFNVGHRGLRESRMYLPMAMFTPHDEQAKKNHCDQDCERDGINVSEAVAILSDSKFEPLDDAMGVMILMEFFNNWRGQMTSEEIECDSLEEVEHALELSLCDCTNLKLKQFNILRGRRMYRRIVINGLGPELLDGAFRREAKAKAKVKVKCTTCMDTGKVLPDVPEHMQGDLHGVDVSQPCPDCKGTEPCQHTSVEMVKGIGYTCSNCGHTLSKDNN